MTLSGVAVVARQEFLERIRKGRWRWLLVAWVVVLLVFMSLLRTAIVRTGGAEVQPYRGTIMFGALMLLVLSLSLLVAPALAAQSINGDRERGTLATLQVTLLTPAEIAVGKFAAAWLSSLVFLALTLPFVVWAMAEGGVAAVQVPSVLLVMTVLLATVIAVALALSALLARSTTSAVLAYLAVFALGIGTVIVFGLVTALTVREVRHEDVGPRGERVTYVESQARTDRTWVLLAPNPFVVLADAAPARPACPEPTGWSSYPPEGDDPVGCSQPRLDPLGMIGRELRNLRVPPTSLSTVRCRGDECTGQEVLRAPAPERPRPKPVWPTGLAVDLALGFGALVITVRRLRTPTHRLARGVRIA